MRLFSREFWNDFVLTSTAELVVMACALLAPAAVARLGGMETLGAYLLIRRLTSSLVPPLSLGMAVALPRYLPLQKDPRIQVRWSVLAIAITSGMGLFCVLLINLFRLPTATLLLGKSSLEDLSGPLALLVFASLFHTIVYGHYRGMVQMRFANMLQVFNLGFLPLAALLQLNRMGLAKAVDLTAYLMMGCSAFFLLPLGRQLLATRVTETWMGPACRGLFSYGLGRVPAFWLSGILLTLAPIWLAHKASMADVGIYSLALSFMRMAGAFFAPFGLLLLPRLAEAQQHGPHAGVKHDLQLLFRMAVLFALFMALQASALSKTLLTVWIGSAPATSNLLFVPLILVLPFYLAYEVLRNPIDAASALPYNTIALGIAVIVLVLSVVGGSPARIVAGQCTSFMILGSVTMFFLKRLYRLKGASYESWLAPVIYCGVSGILTCIIQNRLHPAILFLIPYELALFAGFVAVVARTSRALSLHEISAA